MLFIMVLRDGKFYRGQLGATVSYRDSLCFIMLGALSLMQLGYY